MNKFTIDSSFKRYAHHRQRPHTYSRTLVTSKQERAEAEHTSAKKVAGDKEDKTTLSTFFFLNSRRGAGGEPIGLLIMNALVAADSSAAPPTTFSTSLGTSPLCPSRPPLERRCTDSKITVRQKSGQPKHSVLAQATMLVLMPTSPSTCRHFAITTTCKPEL